MSKTKKKLNIGRLGTEAALFLRERKGGTMFDKRTKRQRTRSAANTAAIREAE